MPGSARIPSKQLIAVMCSILLVRAVPPSVAQEQAQPQAQAAAQNPKIPNDQLDSLVAPIALYPDPLLAQVLAASTYPLEIMQLQQWLARNSGLTGKALADAVAKQPWDPSIQWMTDLGNAFLAQESGVMDAVQRMRQKAAGTGNLKSTEQQMVETKVIEN